MEGGSEPARTERASGKWIRRTAHWMSAHLLALALGAGVGAIGATVYIHVEDYPPNPFLTVSVAPSARPLISDVECGWTTGLSGHYDGVAQGQVSVTGSQVPEVIKIGASFFSHGSAIETAYTYFDPTDPTRFQRGSGIYGFSVAGFGNFTGAIPTSCRITATTDFGSSLGKVRPVDQ